MIAPGSLTPEALAEARVKLDEIAKSMADNEMKIAGFVMAHAAHRGLTWAQAKEEILRCVPPSVRDDMTAAIDAARRRVLG